LGESVEVPILDVELARVFRVDGEPLDELLHAAGPLLERERVCAVTGRRYQPTAGVEPKLGEHLAGQRWHATVGHKAHELVQNLSIRLA
jgi:hypothetical protein